MSGVNAAANTGTLYLIDPQTGAVAATGTASQIAYVDAAGAAEIAVVEAASRNVSQIAVQSTLTLPVAGNHTA
jgi:phosphoribosylformylglycinamidine (FGAM) synthase-like enzyme